MVMARARTQGSFRIGNQRRAYQDVYADPHVQRAERIRGDADIPVTAGLHRTDFAFRAVGTGDAVT